MNLRIIAGEFGSRGIKSPKGRTTRPMSDRVRGALFSSLGNITGKTVLDAYGGSGAVGLEAVSRGAGFVQAIEIDNQSFKLIEENASALGASPDRFNVSKANCASWIKNNPETTFDIVIADPPYNKINYDQLDTLATALNKDGLFVLSMPGHMEPPQLAGLKLIQRRSYGDASLAYYEH